MVPVGFKVVNIRVVLYRASVFGLSSMSKFAGDTPSGTTYYHYDMLTSTIREDIS